jgi:hypothetical protein
MLNFSQLLNRIQDLKLSGFIKTRIAITGLEKKWGKPGLFNPYVELLRVAHVKKSPASLGKIETSNKKFSFPSNLTRYHYGNFRNNGKLTETVMIAPDNVEQGYLLYRLVPNTPQYHGQLELLLGANTGGFKSAGAMNTLFQTSVEHYLDLGGGQPPKLSAGWGSASSHYRHRGFRTMSPLANDQTVFLTEEIDDHLSGKRPDPAISALLRKTDLTMQQTQHTYDQWVNKADNKRITPRHRDR